MFKKYAVALIALSACATQDNTEITTADPAEELPASTEQVDDTETSPEPAVDPCLPVEDEVGMRFEGSVRYSDGTIGDDSNTRVAMCCDDGCQSASWGDDGFCYTGGQLDPGVYSFKVMPLGSRDHATPLSFITVEEEDIILEEPILVPEFSHVGELEDGIFDAGNGLKIDVDVAGYSGAGDFLAAVEVDPEADGLPLDGFDTDKVVGVWYLGAFDAELYPKWTFDVEDLDLPVGASVEIFNGSYHAGEWLSTGTATVDSDGVLRVDLDSGISILSTLVLVEL